ncbi:MAG: YgjP-like metallopeptidase domain-containing protein, partial [Sporomusa sp.]
MPSINFNGQAINYIFRLDKRRKTIQIKVVAAADLEIVSPAKLSNIEITEILATKKRWLANRFGKLAQLAASPINQHLVSGAQLLYQGKPYTLQVLLGGNKPEIELTTNEIIVRQPPGSSGSDVSFLTKGIVKAWLLDQAGKLFFEKTRYWATV